ncbi:hypothetical protein [Jeotgalibacillus malaysiensis]|uniref:hypothetical protein n=1 Tax=Jeotgalibacillus malaysiensis TaxID=1508404 RepID=UPI003850AE13
MAVSARSMTKSAESINHGDEPINPAGESIIGRLTGHDSINLCGGPINQSAEPNIPFHDSIIRPSHHPKKSDHITSLKVT